jgi:DNA-binding NarL/FixJ family response regulator
MQKILLLTHDHDRGLQLQEVLERQMPFQVQFIDSLQSLSQKIENTVVNLVILDVNVINKEIANFIQEVSYAAYPFNMIVLTDGVAKEFVHAVYNVDDVHILLRPIVEKNILGLARKLLIAKKIPKQVNRRFNTDQMAEIESLTTGDQLLSNMYNLSRGGAYCEFQKETGLAVGDLIRLKVSNSDKDEVRSVKARVVWTTDRGRYSGRTGCGLRFVTANEVVRNLTR